MKRTGRVQASALFSLFLLLLRQRQSHSWSLNHRASLASNHAETAAIASSRRRFLSQNVQAVAIVATTTVMVGTATAPAVAAAAPSLDETVSLIQQARAQLEPVPQLIKQEKWDSVRAILITPPLSDCWAKTGRPLLNVYATALGDAGLDELAALEARDQAISHLRYLDMAVYSKMFLCRARGRAGYLSIS